MFELTDTARKELDVFFDGKDKSPIRVYLAPGGCCGPRLALALDEPRDEDKVFDENGYSFCVNTELLTTTGDIKIDFSPMGFSVDTQHQLGGGGSCGSGGGCSGCSGA